MLNREEFNEKMLEVASLLKVEWRIEEEQYDNRGFLIGQGQGLGKILISNGGYPDRGKIRVSSLYPRTNKEEYIAYDKEITINIAETKADTQIAKDIQSRFLPTY